MKMHALLCGRTNRSSSRQLHSSVKIKHKIKTSSFPSSCRVSLASLTWQYTLATGLRSWPGLISIFLVDNLECIKNISGNWQCCTYTAPSVKLPKTSKGNSTSAPMPLKHSRGQILRLARDIFHMIPFQCIIFMFPNNFSLAASWIDSSVPSIVWGCLQARASTAPAASCSASVGSSLLMWSSSYNLLTDKTQYMFGFSNIYSLGQQVE